MNVEHSRKTSALVDPAWVAAHKDDPDVCLIEIAGLGQDDLQAYRAGHVPGAHGWKWKDMLWESLIRTSRRRRNLRGASAPPASTTTPPSCSTARAYSSASMPGGCSATAATKSVRDARRRALPLGRGRTAAGNRRARCRAHRERMRQPGAVGTMRISPRRRAAFAGSTTCRCCSTDDRPRNTAVNGSVLRARRLGAMCYGRIPGARHVFFDNLLTANKSLKSRDELKSVFECKRRRRRARTSSLTAGSATARRCSTSRSPKCRSRRVKVYDGSWTEWGNMVGPSRRTLIPGAARCRRI